MATRVEIKGERISSPRILVGFLPLAFGYFLSVLFQGVDPLVADDLMTDLAIGKGTLGILTAAFPVAFALCLLPAGIAIDRTGPRPVQSVMMGVMALGALIVSVSTGSFGLVIGRALLGASAASALLAAMQAIVTRFPRERLGLVTGCLITGAGLAALAIAGPLFATAQGWRTLYMVLAALAALGAALSVLLIPGPAGVGGEGPDQGHGLTFVLRDPLFWRLAPLAAMAVGTVWATQGPWVAAWFAAMSSVKLTSIITYITIIAVGQTVGALVWGALADWAVQRGRSAANVFVAAVALGICIQLAAVAGISWPSSIVWSLLVAGAAAMLPFVILLSHFPRAYAARACACVGVLLYVATFLIQSAVGAVVAIWPQGASSQTSATAYAVAFLVPTALQLAALAWFVLPRSRTREAAPGDAQAAAFARQVQGFSEPPPLPAGMPPPDAAAAPAATDVEPIDVASAPAETVGETELAASAPAETAEATDAATEPASLTATLPDAAPPADAATEPVAAADPIDTAVAPTEMAGATEAADPVSAESVEASSDTATEPASPATEPADSAVEIAAAVDPIDASLAPTETTGEAELADPAPAETAAALTDTAAESASLDAPPEAAVTPTDPATAHADAAGAVEGTVATLTDAALRSILDAPLSLGPVAAIDAAPRDSADTPDADALGDRAEIAQPQVQELSLPRIAPSHVQALNAFYRRRPALAATIGGRQTSIVAAWPPPDRRPDASHRLALRLDGEPGELWLPQSLIGILVDSVDPVLSLDRLGPDRAAIILEFALDSALASVERGLGCKLEIESYSGQVERRQSDEQVPLFFNLVIEGHMTAGCELRILPDGARRLAEGLDRYAGIARPVFDLPIPVCLRVAAANLAAAEIERLSPDDVVLVDASCEPGDAVIAVIGERLVAPVAFGPEGHRLAAYPIPGATSSWAWSMPTDAMAGAWEADAETDNRSLHVLFEIGRFELPASQVKQLAPNFPLPLEPQHDRTVDIVVDGQRIGRGAMMRIGNRTGVRIIAVRERPRAAGPEHALTGKGASIG